MTINHGEHMQSYIKPKSFYDSFGDVQPSQPYSYTYGDRPVFEFSFLPGEIAEGDTLVYAVDNDMVFYDSTPSNLLHSASCMVVVRHDVTAEEATAGKVQLRIETRTLKFRDVVNGKVRPVEVISGLYRRRGNGDDVSYVLLAKGRAFANGIIADYDALPEPITTDEYYTKGDIDGRLDAKADAATLVAHTDNADIHVTLQDKTTWDSKADIGDIGNATVTITQDGATRGSFSVNASENVTIDLTGGAQADWNETDTTSPAYIQHKPDIIEAPAVAGTAGQVLTKTADGQEWADAPGGGGDNTTDYLCFTTVDANSTVRLDKNGNPPTISLEYSTDKRNWTEYTWSGNTGATITLANTGDSVWLRGDNTTLTTDNDNFHRFEISGSIEATGNVMSLLDRQCNKNAVPEYCFSNLFHYLPSLNKAPKLPAKTLAKYCYKDMFSGCQSLTKAPELPATTLADYCYQNMFGGCSSLTKAPELPATTLALGCYNGMFGGCSSLTKAPELPATTLAESCYNNMFGGCTSLTEAPELPATNLANNCYNHMLAGCKSLTTAPELPATTLAESCYRDMFSSCKALKKVKVGFTYWKDDVNATTRWLTNVPSEMVFESPSALDCSIRDFSHVPAGWTIVRTDSPKSITLPAKASSEATYQVSPNTPSVPVVAVASALTLNAKAIDTVSIAYAEIVLDVATGATVTAGTNMTLVDTPTADKRNICVCRWSKGVAKLYVTIVEDLPQA